MEPIVICAITTSSFVNRNGIRRDSARYVFGYVKRGKSDISIYNEYQQVSLMFFLSVFSDLALFVQKVHHKYTFCPLRLLIDVEGDFLVCQEVANFALQPQN